MKTMFDSFAEHLEDEKWYEAYDHMDEEERDEFDDEHCILHVSRRPSSVQAGPMNAVLSAICRCRGWRYWRPKSRWSR